MNINDEYKQNSTLNVQIDINENIYAYGWAHSNNVCQLKDYKFQKKKDYVFFICSQNDSDINIKII